MGWHSEKSLYSLTIGEIIKEREKVESGYHSDYFEEIIDEQKNDTEKNKNKE